MADPRRLRILDAVVALMASVLESNGFRTDVGAHVYFGEVPLLGKGDEDIAVCVITGDDQILGGLQRKADLELPVHLVVIQKPGLAQPARMRELALADLKQAMESDPAELMGLLKAGRDNPEGMTRGVTVTFDRLPGSEYTGCQITYGLKYAEAWGLPEA